MFGVQVRYQFGLCRLLKCDCLEMKARLAGPAALDELCRTFDLRGRDGAKRVCSNLLDCFIHRSHGHLFCRHVGFSTLGYAWTI